MSNDNSNFGREGAKSVDVPDCMLHGNTPFENKMLCNFTLCESEVKTAVQEAINGTVA